MKREILVNVRLSVNEKETLEGISQKLDLSQSEILRRGIELIELINQNGKLDFITENRFKDILPKIADEVMDFTISNLLGDRRMKERFLQRAEGAFIRLTNDLQDHYNEVKRKRAKKKSKK